MTDRPVALRVLPDAIPRALRGLDRFVVWEYERRDGRWTKPPRVATDPARRASSTDSSTWRSFDDARSAVEDGKADGLGIALGRNGHPDPADRLVALDFDHCIEDGRLDPKVAVIITRVNSYAEISPSGHGIRILAYGDLPSGGRKRGPVEMYDRARCNVTLTGHHVEGTPLDVQERPTEIAEIHREIFGSPDASRAIPEDRSVRSDDDVIARSRAFPKFAGLFDRGEIDYPSHSEADAALCCVLARVTRDPAQIDRIFKRSKLAREKWDRADYRDRTIAQALQITPHAEDRQVELIPAATVGIVKLEWIWYARLALGAITLLEGAPEKGKSTILIDLAARVSRGDSFPGETSTRPPGTVVMLVAEDDLQTTVVPRLIAAGADLDRIFFLGATKDDGGQIVPFHLSDDADRLALRCREVGATLVIVDPLVSFLGSRRGRVLNTNNDLEVRKALAPLKKLAEDLRAAVVAIRHYRKGRGTDAIEAGGGSIGFAALVRVILAALPDPDDDSKYLLAVAKNNLIQKKKRPAYAYEIVPWSGDPEIGCIQWGHAVDVSAGEILAQQAAEGEATGKVGEAVAFLTDYLAGGTWIATTEILRAANEKHGLSERAIRRARARLPIDAEKHGRPWFWRWRAEDGQPL